MLYATIDIETTGLNRYKDEITWIGVGIADNLENEFSHLFIYNAKNPLDIKKFLNLVGNLAKKKVSTVFQNGKFDTLFLEEKLGTKIPISEDVMLMATAYDLAEEHGLKYMAQKYLGVPDWDIKKKEKLSGDADVVVPYLKLDVIYTWQLFQYFSEHMTEQHIKIYRKLLLPAYRMYRDVERNGAYIDVKQLRKVRKEFAQTEEEKLKRLTDLYDINWNSAKQVQEVLFKQEGLPILKKSEKTGAPCADAGVLRRLAGKGYKIPKLILEYKEVNTLNKMFLSRWEDDLGSDKRMHPSFNLTNVVSGRTSCSNPNFQQVPRNKTVRGLFTAPEGKCFFEADYSQLELRIAADYANDPTMLKIYREGGDIHTSTAKLMTNGREPTKEERGKAKAVNFGFLYGMSAKTFVGYAYDSYGVVFSQAEAENFRELFFAKYSRLLPWHHEQELLCEAMGGVTNKFGRFRKLPNIYSTEKYLRSSAVRRAINTPVQGTGSDLLISSATEINKRFKSYGLKIVGTVHDSILGEFCEEDKDWIVDEIKKIMLHPPVLDIFEVELKVNLDVDIGVGPWGTH